MVEAGKGVFLVPASVRHLRSNGVSFKSLRNRGCLVEVVLAWRDDDPDSIRDAFLDLLRKNRAMMERFMEQR
jgi:hypothetical protein